MFATGLSSPYVAMFLTSETRASARELARYLTAWTTGIAPESFKVTPTQATIATCEEITALAVRHAKLAEHACNRDLTKHEIEEDGEIERLIRLLVKDGLRTMPDGTSLAVRFDGDPRGYTVKIHVPGDAARPYGNTWGMDGDYGVG